jgi:hypothetical protein
VQDGFSREILLNDPDLVSLRGDREYEAMRAAVRSRIAAERRARDAESMTSTAGASVPERPRD